MCQTFGYNVRKLRRVRIMNIHLGQLANGKWRDLTKGELSELFELLDYR